MFLREHPNERRLVPAGRALEFVLAIPRASAEADQYAILTSLLRTHERSRNSGTFSLSHTGAIYHIEPSSILKKDGKTERVRSILDTKIAFPVGERNVLQALQLALTKLEERSGVHVVIGGISFNLLRQTTTNIGAEDQTAKEVLVSLFEEVNKTFISRFNEPRRIVWRLHYAPDAKVYFFNWHVVMIEENSPFGGKVRRPI
jgi:hypothetical protein